MSCRDVMDLAQTVTPNIENKYRKIRENFRSLAVFLGKSRVDNHLNQE